jgi:serine/threonine protein kinase
MAPEVAVRGGNLRSHRYGNQGYDEKCDIWSIGILAYELCSGRTPYENTNPHNMTNQICNVNH